MYSCKKLALLMFIQDLVRLIN